MCLANTHMQKCYSSAIVWGDGVLGDMVGRCSLADELVSFMKDPRALLPPLTR